MAVAIMLVAVAPEAASADIRSVNVSDATGDSSGTPSQDLLSTYVKFDSNGTLSVLSKMNGDVASGPPSFILVEIASYTPPRTCGGVTVSLFFATDTPSNAFASVTGVSGTLAASAIVNGTDIFLTTSAPTAIAGKDWTCLKAVLISGKDANAPIYDALSAPAFFDGFGPDADGDAVADNVDKCPADAGIAPSGCPADTDGDTIPDSADKCPAVAGSPPTGCPATPKLSRSRAKTAARAALLTRFGTTWRGGTLKTVACTRLTSTVYECRVAWRYHRVKYKRRVIVSVRDTKIVTSVRK